MRAIAAMSGGVDSAVSAALLRERGYDVEGLTMLLWKEPSAQGDEMDGISAARSVCLHLGIPHHVIDLREPFLQRVVAYFVREYARGRTPNPCLQCNRLLKFGLLLDYAKEQGYAFLATGHYARIEQTGEAYRLLSGLDASKDQSYVLYALQQRHLASVLLPLGELYKTQVRALAARWGLPVAERPESQDVCFLRDNDYRRFLIERSPEAIVPGPIYDQQGRLRGQHKGLPFYTVGQREGLGIAAGQPLYVLELDIQRNALVVGTAQELGHHALLAEEMSYISGQEQLPGTPVEAKIRYRGRRVPARVWGLPNMQARVILEQPLRDITPGQAVVLYQGEQLLGGGIIARAIQCEPTPGE